MKTMILVFATIGLISTTSYAALSGFHDSAAKIRAALESEELADKMSQMPIENLSIVQTNGGGSAVVMESKGCGYAAYLDIKLPEGMGATTYEVESVVGPLCKGTKF